MVLPRLRRHGGRAGGAGRLDAASRPGRRGRSPAPLASRRVPRVPGLRRAPASGWSSHCARCASSPTPAGSLAAGKTPASPTPSPTSAPTITGRPRPATSSSSSSASQRAMPPRRPRGRTPWGGTRAASAPRESSRTRTSSGISTEEPAAQPGHVRADPRRGSSRGATAQGTRKRKRRRPWLHDSGTPASSGVEPQPLPVPGVRLQSGVPVSRPTGARGSAMQAPESPRLP